MDCRLCCEIGDEETDDNLVYRLSGGERVHTRVIERNEVVALVPIGPLCPGHLLVVPKRHVATLRELDSNALDRVEEEARGITETLAESIGPMIWFEHGAAQEQPWACLPHAHLHLVPCTVDIAERLNGLFPQTRISGISDLPSATRFDEQSQYVFLHGQTRDMIVYHTPILPSQYMRQILATLDGQYQPWDWRVDPKWEDIDTTLDMFRGPYPAPPRHTGQF